MGAMMCLLVLFMNCDTMQDVKKIENETNNLALLSVSGLSGGGPITPVECLSGASPLSFGVSYPILVSGFIQTDKFVINILSSDIPMTLRVQTTGSVKLYGILYGPNCSEITRNGTSSGNFTINSYITTSGNYWVEAVASDSDGLTYNISATKL